MTDYDLCQTNARRRGWWERWKCWVQERRFQWET